VRERGVDFAATGFGGGEGEDGAEAFAAGEKAVAHRLVERGGLYGRLREKLTQRLVDQGGAFLEISF
jgi:hypothetical protein